MSPLPVTPANATCQPIYFWNKYTSIAIRPETKQEYFTAENCYRSAFWNVYMQGCYEHFLVHAMRGHKDFIPELSFVLEYNNDLIGGIFFTRSQLIPSNGTLAPLPVLTFGPVFIEPKFQGQGFGKELMHFAIERAKDAGHKAIVILGYPRHYKGLDFCGGKKYHISMPDGKFYQSLLVLPLQEHALDDFSGHIQFSDIFDFKQEDVEIFDKQFPPKEKLVLPGQKEFEKACTLLDN